MSGPQRLTSMPALGITGMMGAAAAVLSIGTGVALGKQQEAGVWARWPRRSRTRRND